MLNKKSPSPQMDLPPPPRTPTTRIVKEKNVQKMGNMSVKENKEDGHRQDRGPGALPNPCRRLSQALGSPVLEEGPGWVKGFLRIKPKRILKTL